MRNLWASARRTQMRNLGCAKTLLIFQNAKYLHRFVSVPCLAEADAASVLVKYEIISADLMLDYARISIAKQCGERLYSCRINSPLLGEPWKSHMFGPVSHINNWKWELEMHTVRTVWMLKAFWLEAVGTMGHSYSLFHFLIKVNSADFYRNSAWCCFPRQTNAICSFQGSRYWNQKVYWCLSVLLKYDKMLKNDFNHCTNSAKQSCCFLKKKDL